MARNYECSICGKSGVKLWRPYMGTEPLICAECAEKRQTKIETIKYEWERQPNRCWVGKPTKVKITLKPWKVNEEGKVPDYSDPGPEEMGQSFTDQLIVDLTDVSDAYTSGSTNLVPAVPGEEEDAFWGYTSVPEDKCKWWKDLPTR